MAKYIHDTIKNNLRSIVSPCTKPQSKAIHEIVRGLLLAQKPILNELAQQQEVSTKKQAEKYGYHLGNVELRPHVEAHARRRVQKEMSEDTIIAYDLSDIAKPHAKAMEGLSKIWDGSKKKAGWGYTLHGVGVNDMLVHFQIHDAAQKTLNQTRQDIVKQLSEAVHKKGIWVMDRGNDHKAFLVYLRQELNVQFVCRIKRNRHVILKETGEKLSVDQLTEGKHEVYLMNEHNTKVDMEASYTVIIYRHMKKTEPLRLLTSFEKDKYTAHEFATIYLQRWGVENSFKRAKQRFGLELVRLFKLQRLENMVALIQFTVNISRIMFVDLQRSTQALLTEFILLFKRFVKIRNLTFTVDSFITFLSKQLTPLIRKWKPPPNQPSLFSRKQEEKLGVI